MPLQIKKMKACNSDRKFDDLKDYDLRFFVSSFIDPVNPLNPEKRRGNL